VRPAPRGYTFFVAPEIEYFYFEGLETATAPVPIDRGSYFDLTARRHREQLRRRTVLTLEEMGIGVEHAQHEDAPGQHEIDLRYTDGPHHGRHRDVGAPRGKGTGAPGRRLASFMPKPLANVQGSGMHTHLSLWRDEQNAFIGDGPYGLSDVAAKFIAGLVRHAPEITAVTTSGSTPTSDSCPGRGAGRGQVGALRRRRARAHPSVKPGRVDSTRVEIPFAGPAANPYLAFAVILAAGLRGVRGGYELPAEGERTAPCPSPSPRP